MSEIRVALAGVGNCASALIQGIKYYENAKEGQKIPGLMHIYFGQYHIRDIKFVAAFEVNELKVGKDLSEAIFVKPNCCSQFVKNIPKMNIQVQKGPALDGVAKHMIKPFNVNNESKSVEVSKILKERHTDILINFLPVGSYKATRYYAKAALDANCGFINCIPEFIASNDNWTMKFVKKKLPIAGDDIKSQLGATILHRALVRLFVKRGVLIDDTYQLNIGGNTDFLNMAFESRLKRKRISKTEAVTSMVPYSVPTRIGPSDYVPFLEDKKICYISVKGHKFGNQPVKILTKLEVEDSPNSAGMVIDVIRAMKIALDRKIIGRLISISAYAFKHPPIQVEDDIAYNWVEEYINGKRVN